MSTQAYKVPVYYNCDNGLQNIWLNEELTESPVNGHFHSASATKDFTAQNYYTDDEHPIDSIWLGKVHVTGIMNNLATEANTYAGHPLIFLFPQSVLEYQKNELFHLLQSRCFLL